MKYATFDERQSTGKNRVKVYSYSTDSLLQKSICIFVGNEFSENMSDLKIKSCILILY